MGRAFDGAYFGVENNRHMREHRGSAARRARAARWSAAALALLALAAAGCGDGGAPSGDGSVGTPPGDAVARYRELAELRESASFHVVYSVDCAGSSEVQEYALLQDGGKTRWDRVQTYGSALIAMSSVDDGTGGGTTCTWQTSDDSATGDVWCEPGFVGPGFYPDDPPADAALPLERIIESRVHRVILGVETECFELTVPVVMPGYCLSAEGVPLAISYGGLGAGDTGCEVTAMEIHPPPNEADLLTPIVPDARPKEKETWRGVPLADLALPAMPLVEQYLRDPASIQSLHPTATAIAATQQPPWTPETALRDLLAPTDVSFLVAFEWQSTQPPETGSVLVWRQGNGVRRWDWVAFESAEPVLGSLFIDGRPPGRDAVPYDSMSCLWRLRDAGDVHLSCGEGSGGGRLGFLAAALSRRANERLPDRAMAGRTAACYAVDVRHYSATEVCLDPSGIPLYLSMTEEGSSVPVVEMRAVSVITTAQDLDFPIELEKEPVFGDWVVEADVPLSTLDLPDLSQFEN